MSTFWETYQLTATRKVDQMRPMLRQRPRITACATSMPRAKSSSRTGGRKTATQYCVTEASPADAVWSEVICVPLPGRKV